MNRRMQLSGGENARFGDKRNVHLTRRHCNIMIKCSRPSGHGIPISTS